MKTSQPTAAAANHRIVDTLAFCFLLLCSSLASAEPARTLQPEVLAELKFQQNLDQVLPLRETLRDQHGQPILLGDCLGQQPTILVMGYYSCPMLCHTMLNGLLKGLNDLRRTAGKDFSVLFISVDPRETPQLAAAKRASYLRRYDRPGSEKGWHFLTGEAATVRRIATTVGFPYRYDPVTKQYAHPAGIVILTPEGRISQYLLGVSYPPRELNNALVAASKREISHPVKDLLLLCFHYNPITGKYGSVIMGAVRVGGLLTLLGLVVLILRSMRQPHRGKPHPAITSHSSLGAHQDTPSS